MKDYQKLEEDIKYFDYNLDKTKVELKRWISGDLQDVCLTTESEGAKVEERIEAMENELAHKMNEMHKMHNLLELISKF